MRNPDATVDCPARRQAPRQLVNRMGMELDEWKLNSCVAEFGVGDDWATLYMIQSSKPGKGHAATELLRQAKTYYEKQGKHVGGTVALNDRMRAIYQRLGIEEYA